MTDKYKAVRALPAERDALLAARHGATDASSLVLSLPPADEKGE